MTPRPALLLCLALAAGCHPASRSEAEEVVQVVGDLLASVDEASQGGNLAASLLRRPRAFEPTWQERLAASAWGTAEAHATCAGLPFSACADGQRTRALGGCYLGWGLLEGTVALQFDDTACALSSEGQGVTRTADVRLQGPRAGTLRLAGDGTTLSRTAEGFTLEVAGLSRTQVDEAGATVLQLQGKGSSALQVRGASRAGRTLSGDGFKVLDVPAEASWHLSTEGLTWSESCNCADSGVLGGQATGGRGGTLRLELVTCGKGLLSVNGGEAEEVILDRCGTL